MRNLLDHEYLETEVEKWMAVVLKAHSVNKLNLSYLYDWIQDLDGLNGGINYNIHCIGML